MIPLNKYRKFLFALVVFLIGFFGITVAQTSKEYINKYRPLSDSLGKAYGIPSELILAIAILESGYGRSRNAKLLNNHFGIVGKNNLAQSHGIKSRYKQYKSVSESYRHFCEVVARKPYYKKLKNNRHCKDWVDLMKAAGYSEYPDEWASKVLSIVQQVSKK